MGWKNFLSNKVKQCGSITFSLHSRLFIFLSVLVIIMFIVIMMFFSLTDSFTAELHKTENFIIHEFSNIKRHVEKQYGDISAQAINLSKELSQSIENGLMDNGLHPSDLNNHPDVLEVILSGEFERLLGYLKKTKSSGIFVILDATVNKHLEGAEYSRAGLYLKNMEPNVLSSAEPYITVLRGNANIGRSRGVRLHSQWSMEFDVQDAPYYSLPLAKSRDSTLPLSRLYYWSHALILPQTSEEVMLCSIPLIDSSGTAFGVCGFEVSAMLFKLNFMPNNSVYKRMFCMLCPAEESNLIVGRSLFSGSYAAFNNSKMSSDCLTYTNGSSKLYKYRQISGKNFVGIHGLVKLYPNNSAFEDQKFALALVMPQEDLDSFVSPMRMRFIILCSMFLCIGIGLSFLISRRYIKPVIERLSLLKQDSINNNVKTNIQEIDEIIEQIREKHANKSLLPEDLFADFIHRVKTLTPTEKIIFRYYLEGKTNEEILSQMYISLSTFKTHNSHIYRKLGVSSKNELLLYIKLIKKIGLLSEIV